MPVDVLADWLNSDLPYKKSLELAEIDTLQKVDVTLSSIENAIQTWKKAGKKPEDLRKLMIEFQNFKQELELWQKESMLSYKSSSLESREERLIHFAKICDKYSLKLLQKGAPLNG